MTDWRRVARSVRPSQQPRMTWSRVNSLIDGIMGFSATVLILRLGAPAYVEGDLGAALAHQAPYYVLYALGFFQILSGWSVLRRVSAWTTGIDFYGMLLGLAPIDAMSTEQYDGAAA